MKKLDLATLPFAPINLIEASAGTGKTYTLTRLFLRALLQDTKSDIELGTIELPHILLVTFTNAATEELRHRIGETLRDARKVLKGQGIPDPTLQAILAECKNQSLALYRIDYALQAIDQAQVMTIHGFCQRLQKDYGIEAEHYAEFNLSFDQDQWIREAVLDYWRTHVVNLDAARLGLLLKEKSVKSPSALAAVLTTLINKNEVAILPDSLASLEQRFAEFTEKCKQLKTNWEDSELRELLATHLKKNRTQAKVNTWEKMDQFCQSDELIPELDSKSSGWAFWAASTMTGVLTKAHVDHANHPFFQKAEALAIQSDELIPAYLANTLREALDYVKTWLKRFKNTNRVLSPDDLLIRVRDFLCKPENKSLRQRISRQYPVAFVDEFQDTDSTQWEIFKQLYHDNQHSAVFFIGDPKQAIYGFRGADIETYYRAKAIIPETNHYFLDTNWRSSRVLIDGINALLANNATALRDDYQFDFHPVQAGNTGDCSDIIEACECLVHETLTSPITNRNDFLAVSAQMAATRIATLLARPAPEVQPGDITVLVRDRNEAAVMKQALKHQGINSVFLIRESVFRSTAAQGLIYALKGILNPQHPSYLKTALASSFFSFTVPELQDEFDSMAWFNHAERFANYQQLWSRSGVMAACFQLIDDYRLSAIWLARENGERFATDVRHLLELIASKATGKSIEQQCQQLEAWQQEENKRHENIELRLETDDMLIKIETIHASKGLEYPLVFLPFVSWRQEQNELLIKNQDKSQYQFDFRKLNSPTKAKITTGSDEELRLLYVALTRAKNECYFVLLPTNTFEKTAIAKLLGHSGQFEFELAKTQLEKIPNIRIHCVSSSEPSEVAVNSEHVEKTLHLDLTRTFSRHLNYSIRNHSYTSLVHINPKLEHSINPVADSELGLHDEESNQVQSKNGFKPANSSHSLTPFNFPAGAHTGLLLHTIFEHIQFQVDDTTLVTSCESALRAWEDPIKQNEDDELVIRDFLAQWIRIVLQTPLNTAETALGNEGKSAPLTLDAIFPQMRNIEMEFNLPLSDVKTEDLNHLLDAHGYELSEPLAATTLSGLFRGFVDLVFEHEGKIYILDYKSNALGIDKAAYFWESMQDAMTRESYHLQYLLYGAAIHIYCQHYKPDYDYNSHFGGVYYLFLRGMSPLHEPGTGVFFHRPEFDCIDALAKLLKGC